MSQTEPRIPAGIDCTGDKIRTKQSFKKETDINNIMAKFVKTGIITPEALNKRQAAFADVSEIGDFRECLEQIAAADAAFMTLGPELRARFENQPAQLLDFCANEENREEAIELGIIEKPEPTQTPPVEAPKAPEPPKEA